jgi:hypothetical protein
MAQLFGLIFKRDWSEFKKEFLENEARLVRLSEAVRRQEAEVARIKKHQKAASRHPQHIF